MLDPILGEILYVDKPYGWTSFDAVKRIRGKLHVRLGIKKLKVGHAGTLDPLATGVLIVCTGKKTKEIERLQQGEKEYVADIRLGATTPSYDLETQVDATYPWEHITEEQVRTVLRERFVGRIEQVPPAFSACKVDGRRAYKIARKGREVELKAKVLEISEIELMECNLPDIKVRVSCSKGTYIRALARDLGEALGSGAHLTGLRRTRVGSVSEHDCKQMGEMLQYLSEVEMRLPEEEEKQ